jgi:hypothetical protein
VSLKPIAITRESRQELEKAAAIPTNMPAKLALSWDSGKGAHPRALANDLWPEWTPKAAVQVLASML